MAAEAVRDVAADRLRGERADLRRAVVLDQEGAPRLVAEGDRAEDRVAPPRRASQQKRATASVLTAKSARPTKSTGRPAPMSHSRRVTTQSRKTEMPATSGDAPHTSAARYDALTRES
jgi:hypothetical protein